ncbi:MAG: ATP-binding protein [Bacteroidales bacterium]|jgi:AAA+ ATPase superfamily predicted ATPase|nr:ATP-binding protein [Bacteroidales bacterium]
MGIFIGRKEEQELINRFLHQSGSKIVTINGRRRIGKSTLVAKIAENCNFFSFSGIAPNSDRSKQIQIDNFLSQLSKKTGNSYERYTDWFWVLDKLSSELPKEEKCVVLFDEISWMAHGDSTFVGVLKNWWDLDISKRENILLIFCGSVSTWINKNIINSTAFYGRVSAYITLEQLSIPESAEFLRKWNFHGSAFEFYKILSVTGGVPWYLERVDPSLTADKNIEDLCFKRNGLLKPEFEKIFNDVFSIHGEVYNRILVSLCDGMKTLSEIRAAIEYVPGGTISHLMDNLITCGFVSKHQQWSFKSKKFGRQSVYRICDPYVRFYLRYIKLAGNREKPPENLDSIVGLQMESLLIQNRKIIWKLLCIDEPLIDNPYIQRSTLSKKGCQIDYLIQTRTNNLYACEFKFQRRSLNIEIITEMREKIDRLSIPRGMAIVPVLFHLGGVSESVYLDNFFYKIIDLADLLEE